MIIHVYKQGDREGMHQHANRVTMLEDGARLFEIEGPTLVLGTRPHTTALAMKDVNWFWIEED